MRANACDPVSAFGGIVARQRARHRGAGRGAGAGVHRSRGGPVVRAGGARGVRQEAEPAGARGRGRRSAPRSTCAASTAACWCSRSTRSTPIGDVVAGGHRGPARPMQQWHDLVVRLAGVRGGQQQRHRVRQGRPGVRHRRRPAEPGRLGRDRRRGVPPAGPSAVCAPATPSSRSATGSTWPRPQGSPRWCSPAAACATTRSSPRPNEHGIAMVFTGERHFRH